LLIQPNKIAKANEDGGEWEEGLRLAPFLSLGTDLIRGDRRCLYLGWLSSLQNDEYDEEEFEPSVPCKT
jgi:hypothetical protein